MSEAIFERMRTASKSSAEQREFNIINFINRRPAARKVSGQVGLELEIEGVRLPNFIDYLSPETTVGWQTHDDGSLRGEESYEYVTGGAINVTEVEGALAALWGTFKSSKSKLALSNRCSTHVHVNCSTLTPKPISSLIALWGIVEEAVTNWCGQSRVSNPFCLRMTDSTASLETWMRALEGKGVEFGNGLKYNNLNLKPLWRMGSVEFRCLRGADNPDMVLQWVRFLWALREEARVSYQNPMRLAQAVSAMGVGGVIEKIIAGNDLQDFWTDVSMHPDNLGRMSKLLREGFLLVQPMLFNIDWNLVPDAEENDDIPEDRYTRNEREVRRQEHENNRVAARENMQPPRARAARPPRAARAGGVGNANPFPNENDLERAINELRLRPAAPIQAAGNWGEPIAVAPAVAGWHVNDPAAPAFIPLGDEPEEEQDEAYEPEMDEWNNDEDQPLDEDDDQ